MAEHAIYSEYTKDIYAECSVCLKSSLRLITKPPITYIHAHSVHAFMYIYIYIYAYKLYY